MVTILPAYLHCCSYFVLSLLGYFLFHMFCPISRAVDKRDGAPKSPSPNSAMKARSSQRLLSNADQLETPPMKRLSSMEEYHDNPRKSSAGGGQQDRTSGSQFKFNGGVGTRWDTPEHDHVDTSKNNLLEGVIQKETCL